MNISQTPIEVTPGPKRCSIFPKRKVSENFILALVLLFALMVVSLLHGTVGF